MAVCGVAVSANDPVPSFMDRVTTPPAPVATSVSPSPSKSSTSKPPMLVLMPWTVQVPPAPSFSYQYVPGVPVLVIAVTTSRSPSRSMSTTATSVVRSPAFRIACCVHADASPVMLSNQNRPPPVELVATQSVSPVAVQVPAVDVAGAEVAGGHRGGGRDGDAGADARGGGGGGGDRRDLDDLGARARDDLGARRLDRVVVAGGRETMVAQVTPASVVCQIRPASPTTKPSRLDVKRMSPNVPEGGDRSTQVSPPSAVYMTAEGDFTHPSRGTDEGGVPGPGSRLRWTCWSRSGPGRWTWRGTRRCRCRTRASRPWCCRCPRRAGSAANRRAGSGSRSRRRRWCAGGCSTT